MTVHWALLTHKDGYLECSGCGRIIAEVNNGILQILCRHSDCRTLTQFAHLEEKNQEGLDNFPKPSYSDK